MDYEKKYNELISKIEKAYLYADTDNTKVVLEEIYPELKQDKDKKIREALISVLKSDFEKDNTIYDITVEEIIDWLEQQGQQEESQVYESKDDKAIICSGTDGDKVVEPKFHEGDWIVQGCNILKILCIDGDYYCYETVGGHVNDMLISEIDSSYHLWTIDDAKDGDVLASEDKNFITQFVAIYKSLGDTEYKGIKDDLTFNSHCFIGFNGKFYEGEEGHTIEDIHPATKGQRDTLMEAMNEGGYTFDFEKKVLNKIK